MFRVQQRIHFMTQILTSLSYPPSSSSHQPLSIGSCSRQFFIDQHWLNNESTDGGPTWSVISPISFDLNHQSNTVHFLSERFQRSSNGIRFQMFNQVFLLLQGFKIDPTKIKIYKMVPSSPVSSTTPSTI